MSACIGIDFGTTNSAAAVVRNGEPRPIPSRDGGWTTPSLVALHPDGTVVVGRQARDLAARHPDRVIYSVKHLLGRPIESVASWAAGLPYRVAASADGLAELDVGGQRHSPVAVAAAVFRQIREDAERELGGAVAAAVVGVPAYFDDAQRQATREAARQAGLDVRRLVNEPTAAAAAYGIDLAQEQYLVVYDLGGGTFDVSILRAGAGVVEVLATCGDSALGGDDIDRRLMALLCAEAGTASPGDPAGWARLRETCERAKVALSSTTEVEMRLSLGVRGGDRTVHRLLRREEFELMIADQLDRTTDICRSALDDAGLRPAQVDEVLLVGGSTRIPLVRRMVAELFGREPCTAVDPDLAVALGAAVQAATLEQRTGGTLVLDVTPLSLRIETLGGLTSTIIPRNTAIPVRRTKGFSTAEDDQPGVTVHVVQGERPLARDNRSLGKFTLEGIPPLPRGVPQVDVTFDIDADGLVHVTARELCSEATRAMTVRAAHQLDPAETAARLCEAAARTEDDRQALEAARERLRLHELVEEVDGWLRRKRRRLGVELRRTVTEAVRRVRSSLRSGDDTAVDAAAKSLAGLLEQHDLAAAAGQGAALNAAGGGAALQ